MKQISKLRKFNFESQLLERQKDRMTERQNDRKTE